MIKNLLINLGNSPYSLKELCIKQQLLLILHTPLIFFLLELAAVHACQDLKESSCVKWCQVGSLEQSTLALNLYRRFLFQCTSCWSASFYLFEKDIWIVV